MKLLIIGEAPGPSGAADPLGGRASRFLAQLADRSQDAFLLAVERRNLLDSWPGGDGEGSAFPLYAAAEAARVVRPTLDGRRVLLLGRVGQVFGIQQGWYEWVYLGTARVARFPHPSGLNRLWNDQAERRAAGRFLRAALYLAEHQ